MRRAFDAAYGVPLVDLYGATEVGTIWLDRGNGGRCVPGVQVRVVDPLAASLVDVPEGGEGELAVRSDAMADGVLGPGGRVQPIAVDGFVRMGDLGVRAADGGLRVTGRIKLVFDVAGLKVNPVEVEQALEAHPDVRAAIVFASAVTDTVNRVAAHVELRDPARRPDPAALRQFLAAVVPPHAVPRRRLQHPAAGPEASV